MSNSVGDRASRCGVHTVNEFLDVFPNRAGSETVLEHLCTWVYANRSRVVDGKIFVLGGVLSCVWYN